MEKKNNKYKKQSEGEEYFEEEIMNEEDVMELDTTECSSDDSATEEFRLKMEAVEKPV